LTGITNWAQFPFFIPMTQGARREAEEVSGRLDCHQLFYCRSRLDHSIIAYIYLCLTLLFIIRLYMTDNSNQASFLDRVSSLVDKWARAIFFGIFLLLPLAVSPFRNLTADFSKHFILVAGIFVVLLFCLISFYNKQLWSKPKNLISYGLLTVGLATLLAASFSENTFLSFLGLGFEKDTLITIVALIIAAFIPSFIYRGKDDLPKFSFWLAMVASIIAILETVFLILINLAGFNSLARFVGLVSSSWYEEATFFGLIVVLVLSLSEFFAKKSSWRFRFFLILSLVLSLLFLGVINYWSVWLSLVIFSALIIVLAVRRSGWVEILNISTLVLIISLLFVIWGGTNSWLGRGVSFVQQAVKINIFEVRPNWSGTYDVAIKTLKADPIFGIGPARFWHAWELSKPSSVNLTPFWNTDFSFGIGFIPSLFASHGLVSGLAWLALLVAIVFLVFIGLKKYWLKPDEKNSLVVLAVIPVLYLWTWLIFRSPDLCILALAFAFLGWFLTGAKEAGITTNDWVIGKSNQAKVLMSRLSWVVFILLLILIAYLFVTFVSLFVFQRGLNLATVDKLDRASSWVTVATWLGRSDIYERQATGIKLAQINQLLVKTATGSPEQIQASFLTLFNSALAHSAQAQKIDPDNYANWLSLARVYSLAVPLGVNGADNQALVAYKKALELNPTNPGLWFEMAQLSLASKKTSEAKDRLNQAIALKSNYLEARFALAQLDINDGLINKAIKDATDMVKLSPNDYNAWFLLGYLQYQHGDIEEATQSFARSLQIQPNYGDAKYYIGLSLDKMGKRQEALGVFQELVKANPGNKALEQIVTNLNSGQPAFGQPAPVKTPTKTKK